MKPIYLQVVLFLFLLVASASNRIQAQIAPELLVKIHTAATSIEMNTIVPSDAGALIFNSEDLKLYVFNGTSWVRTSQSNTFTPGSVIFADQAGQQSERNSKLFWDDTNDRLGINTNTPSETLEVNGNLSLTGRYKDSDGNYGNVGQILSATATGTKWIDNATAPPPIVDNTQVIGLNQTKTLTYVGSNFIPATSVSFVGFNGTINSTTVVSPNVIEVNVTSDNIIADYDVVLSNHGVLNTQWPGNGVDAFIVKYYDGTSQNTAGLTCKTILDDGFSTGDGMYWINPNGGTTADAFQVYCDMTTDGGGWTRLDYAADLPHINRFTSGDSWKWVPNDFSLSLTDTQINDIRSQSTEGKQRYVGTCDGVMHYEYLSGSGNFSFAFGYRFHTGFETSFGTSLYPNTNITVIQDGCSTNDNTSADSIFDFYDTRVPILNVYSRDNGNPGEQYGSPLTSNPAWLR